MKDRVVAEQIAKESMEELYQGEIETLEKEIGKPCYLQYSGLVYKKWVFLFVQWWEYFHDLKDGMFHVQTLLTSCLVLFWNKLLCNNWPQA